MDQTPTIVIVRWAASPFFVFASIATEYVLPFVTVRPITRVATVQSTRE